MTVLPDHQLRKLGKQLVYPFVEENVQPASIDLCLGDEFIVFDAHEGLFIDLDGVHDDSARKVIKEPGKGFILHPGEFVLGVTHESIMLPNNIVARLEGKSSIGRLGLMIHVTAGFVDPGWEGPLTLEIANVRKIPIILRPRKTFCQISFQYMDSAVAKPYQGRYQNASGVEASKYGNKIDTSKIEWGIREASDNPRFGEIIEVPDESGMGTETYEIGKAYWDPDIRGWFVPISENRFRVATSEEIKEAERSVG